MDEPAPYAEPLDPRAQRREILRLAVPAFLALVAEPLFLLTDSAIVGHLGTSQLAGLGVASAALLTAANIFVFLAYGTTAVVARQLGAGSRRGAIAAGVDGTWLAVALGLATAVVVAVLARPICSAFGASGPAVDQAVTYLRIAALGIPGMLVVLATTGVLRGLQDTRTPLVVSVLGFGSNIGLNLLLVFGIGLGIAGSAIGTVIAQTGMAAILAWVLVRMARREGAHLRAHPGRVLAAARDGAPLLVRTLALRAILLLTTWVAASYGTVPLAAYQVTATIWSFLTFTLDALAIAAQALTGRALGAGDRRAARSATVVMVRWGVLGGFVVGLILVALRDVLPHLFTSDPEVRAVISAGLLVVALGQPLSGYVFVVDGVLIGAGDGRWLARAMVACLVAYLPVVAGLHALGPWLVSDASAVLGEEHAITWLWLGFTVFMAVRGALMWLRVRTDRWMVTGA
ncbi:Conserved membrane protein, MatE domain [Nostocoides japonicum T1-X7]|uniref:Conserved membrane protein, MatE domain n=1 Tax=Nostocoides japonicum T1-X7 TaxID=1194083 RepID=A0A077LVC4_9MICO|nr:MATE family efflux transporter [Tetrasphaera japonica]CCH77888.1 Conserved membrane protein, MatE domain [Tetrasphaera japonica T1-X7]